MFYIHEKRTTSYPFKNSMLFVNEYFYSENKQDESCVAEVKTEQEAKGKVRDLHVEQIKMTRANIERAKIEIADYQQFLSENERIMEQLIKKL